MLLSVSPETLVMLEKILLVLVGGICAGFGGVISTWYKAKRARKIRMEEIIGEKRIEICPGAMRRISRLQSLLSQDTLKGSLEYFELQQDWFWDSILFLPPQFRNKWLSIRSNLRKAIRKEKAQESQKDETTRSKEIDNLTELESFIDKLAQESKDIIFQELNLPPIEIEKFPGTNTSDKT